MAITNHNGSITLTSFAELGRVLDPDTLSPGPRGTAQDQDRGSETNGTPAAQGTPPSDLAGLLAELATISTGLETVARQDALARDQAALDLARYETLLADQQEAERALAEVRRVRAAAEQLAIGAFTHEAAAHASEQAAIARAAELSYMQFLSGRGAELEQLIARPHLARALADRRRLAEQQAEAAQRAEAERTSQLLNGLVALDEALAADHLDDAARLLEPLVRQFPEDGDVRKKADMIRWRLRQRVVAPAEEALRDIVRRPYRDDPEMVVTRLAELNPNELPEDLARRIFGLWSNACYSLVQQRGWLKPKRHAPLTSRGMVFARATPEGPDTTVSSLGMPEWWPGKAVTDGWVLKAARPLEPPRSDRTCR